MRDILITAGATRNPIDAMRFISAHSSGRTGAWLAERLCATHPVTVLGSPLALTQCGPQIQKMSFTSTQDLMEKMKTWVLSHPDGLVIHAAAVGDYGLAEVKADDKIPSGQDELILKLVPTPKILNRLKAWAPDLKLASFKAAAPTVNGNALAAIAAAQGARSGSDLVFANTIGQLDDDVLIWTPNQTTWYTKRHLALEQLAIWASAQN